MKRPVAPLTKKKPAHDQEKAESASKFPAIRAYRPF
jgi:hypothetical protein